MSIEEQLKKIEDKLDMMGNKLDMIETRLKKLGNVVDTLDNTVEELKSFILDTMLVECPECGSNGCLLKTCNDCNDKLCNDCFDSHFVSCGDFGCYRDPQCINRMKLGMVTRRGLQVKVYLCDDH